jgi:hypothetical protein
MGTAMGVELESMAIEMPEVEGHPNRAEFRGVLTMLDVASDRPPSGARGHRVVLTRKACEEAIPSLLGMALDYAPALDRHDARRKVGVITSAEVVGRTIEVGGFLYAHDFPEIVEEIRKAPVEKQALYAATGGDQLGMSYEVAEAQIEDVRSAVWVLNKFTFTGAAILKREKAAYKGTWIRMRD